MNEVIGCCQEIQRTIERFGDNPLLFQEDEDYQRSVRMCCIEIGEIFAYRLSDSFRYSLTECNWQQIIRMRHYLVHKENRRGYRRMDIWRFIHQDVPDLQKALEEKMRKEGERNFV
ncbi:HepT-like ribonuclease domain-containing protein [Enterococcus sp. 5B3_DIV0040]|uniref:HepT-like ribonuclease domain-containing protein n=1 Tax=Enterococcus sp. 5B3_DIV0040 TaxID=1834182 RepID=UPI000A357F1A|nr:HepT-like ribonuclease domain-containing protein [Enterococcus sp. 5B3_DIV0040]